MHRSVRLPLAIVGLVMLIISVACQAAETKQDSKGTADMGIAAIDAFIAEQKIDKSSSNWKTSLAKPPKVEFEAGKTYYMLYNHNGRFQISETPIFEVGN